jgi:hypothetical protein
LTWTNAKRRELQEDESFLISNCQVRLKFTFANLGEVYPRQVQTDDDEPLTNYADFAIFSNPQENFQINVVSMKIDGLPYNWFSGQNKKVNNFFKILINYECCTFTRLFSEYRVQ